jgi:hypothetical protein
MSVSVLGDIRVHTCRWCDRFLLDFSSTFLEIQPVRKDNLDVLTRDIVIPMGYKGCLSTCSPDNGTLEELISAAAADGCLFAQNVVQPFKSTHKNEHVQEVFSWTWGIELIGETSTVLLQLYATWGEA